jgi:ABC-type multidrug transport system fused ATPase/permease subunit
MKDFLFSSEQVRTPLGKLSGGERGRLMLAQALAKPSNLLVLDEPTNDLDMETLDVLEEMLAEYPGTILLISHDRDLLNRSVDGIVHLQNGKLTSGSIFENICGGVQLPIEEAWHAARLAGLDADADVARLEARVRPPRNFRNPGAFDYVGYMARQKIFWTASMTRGSSLLGDEFFHPCHESGLLGVFSQGAAAHGNTGSLVRLFY